MCTLHGFLSHYFIELSLAATLFILIFFLACVCIIKHKGKKSSPNMNTVIFNNRYAIHNFPFSIFLFSQGTKVLQMFMWYLNPRQVFDLSQEGPKDA